MPFEIPESWAWARFSTLILKDLGGGTPDKSNPEYWGGDIPWMSVKDFSGAKEGIIIDTIDHITQKGVENSTTNLITSDAIILCTRMGLGKFAHLSQPTAINQDLRAIWISHQLAESYILFWYSTLILVGSGVTVKGIKRDELFSLLVPVPPLNEQKRIVSKIESLLPLVESYGKRQVELDDLNATFPEALKKSILQEAIQGRLVKQDPNDEPASVLLERIREEKERLIKLGKIKRDKKESVIYRRGNSHYEKQGLVERCIDEELPFEIPESWGWSRLETVCSTITDGEHKTPKRTSFFQGYYLLSARNIRDGELSLSNVDFVDKCEFDIISKRCNPKKNDVLISCSGSVGRICVVEDENYYVMVRSAAMASPIIVHSRFLMYTLQSLFVQKQINKRVKKAVQANLFQGAIRELLIPLPPYNEQRRIVSKIESLLPLCKQL